MLRLWLPRDLLICWHKWAWLDWYFIPPSGLNELILIPKTVKEKYFYDFELLYREYGEHDPNEKEEPPMKHFKIIEGYIEDIAFTDDAQSIVTGSNDGIVRILNVSDGTVQREINHGIVIYSVALQSQGDLAAFGDEYGTVSIFNRKSGELLSNFDPHSNVVSSLSFNRSGEFILSSSWDGMVQLWEIDSENSVVLSDSDDEHHFARFSQDGTLVAFAVDKGIITLWDVKNKEIALMVTGKEDSIRDGFFFDNDRKLITCDWGGFINIWDVVSGKTISQIKCDDDAVQSVSLKNNTMIAATACVSDNTVRIWDLAKGQCMDSYSLHKELITRVRFSGDGNILASCSWDGSVCIYNYNSIQKTYK